MRLSLLNLKSLIGVIAAMGMTTLAASVRAANIPIVDDAYVDSTYYTSPTTGLVVSTQNINFDTYTGGSGSSMTPSNLRMKAVSSNGSQQFPGNSKVHGLFKFPQSFFDGVANHTITTASINYYMFNNSLNTKLGTAYTDSRDVALYPMTKAWGTQTVTWRQADTGVPWSTTNTAADHDDPGFGGGGGEFDTTRPILTVNPNTASGTFVQWNITPYLTDVTAMQELHDFGAMFLVTNETTFNENRFFSLSSYNQGVATPSQAPFISTTPEPAGIALIGLLAMPLARRRRKY